MKRRNYIVVMMMGLLLGSCSSEDILSVPNGNGRIRFDVGVSQSEEVTVTPMNGSTTRSAEPLFLPTSSIEMHSGDMKMYANCASSADIPMHNIVPETTTRGSIKTEADFYPDFGLFGYFYDNLISWNESSFSPQLSINKAKATNNNGNWTTNVYWPGASKKATFFAYAPYNANVTLESETGTPKMTFTVPTEIDNQQDLLVAKSEPDISCGGNTEVALNFKHVLSAIKFVKGETPGFSAIKQIQISGVKNQGTLNMDSPSWENVSGNVTYTISTIDENTVCFLMPQTAPSGAKLSVTFSNGATEKTYEADIENTTWAVGYQYIYSLSVNKVTGSFIFEVTSLTESVPVGGGEAKFNVKSYFQYQDGSQKVPIPWSCSYTDDGNTNTLNGDGGDVGEEKSITIGKNTNTIDHTQILKNNKVKGSEERPYDLSTNGGASSMNTANCYVVDSKGTYSIPLVYGCAIKNGLENPISYGTGTYSGNTYSSETFVNHAGEKISSAYINNMVLGTNYGAKLIWQEVKDMITKVELSSDNKSLIFTIGEQIAQGNAIVAYTVDDNVVWSWHIWVTDRNIYATEKVTTNLSPSHDYDFMPVALGWVDSSKGFSPRLCTLNLTQSQSDKNLSVTVNQAGESVSGGTCTYYQWGRKDPLMPSRSIKSENSYTKTCYDISGNTVLFTANTNDKTIEGGILYPEKIINSGDIYNWDTGTTRYDNWNAINGETIGHNYNEVVKTVYDPSPVGFIMPPPLAFTGFSDNGEKQAPSENNCIDKTNGYTDGYNAGYNFYTNSNKTATTYWRACGYRNFKQVNVFSVGSMGSYWSAGPQTYNSGCAFGFRPAFVFPNAGNLRAYGLPVRPVSE